MKTFDMVKTFGDKYPNTIQEFFEWLYEVDQNTADYVRKNITVNFNNAYYDDVVETQFAILRSWFDSLGIFAETTWTNSETFAGILYAPLDQQDVGEFSTRPEAQYAVLEKACEHRERTKIPTT